MAKVWLWYKINAVVITVMSFVISMIMLNNSMFPWPLVIATVMLSICFSIGIAIERRYKWARKGAIVLAIVALPVWGFLGYIVSMIHLGIEHLDLEFPYFPVIPGIAIIISFLPSLLLIRQLINKQTIKEFESKQE